MYLLNEITEIIERTTYRRSRRQDASLGLDQFPHYIKTAGIAGTTLTFHLLGNTVKKLKCTLFIIQSSFAYESFS